PPRHRLHPDSARTDPAAQARDDQRLHDVDTVSDLVRRLSREHRVEALPRPRRGPDDLLHDPGHAHPPRDPDRSDGSDYTDARAARTLRSPRSDRALDAAAVAVLGGEGAGGGV